MILAIAEGHRGRLHRGSWEAIAAAQTLAGNEPVDAMVLGSGKDGTIEELQQAAVATIHAITSPLLDPYTSDAYVRTLAEVVQTLRPEYVVLTCVPVRLTPFAVRSFRGSWSPMSFARDAVRIW
jgi:electron transfer flavoprotein alpha subunit